MKDAYEIIFKQEQTAEPVTTQIVKFRCYTYREAMDMIDCLMTFGADIPGIGRVEASIRPLTEEEK